MTFETRRIFKSAVTSQNLIRELLQLMFLGEYLAPGGDRAWLVSPWVSNVVLLDNRAGSYSSINPDWRQGEIRLAELMTDLMARGTSLGLATSRDAHNEPFIERLTTAAQENAVAEKLTVVRRQHLHTKGILVKRGLLTGSMNLTYRGLELNDEVVVYDTVPKTLAEARLNFESYLGSAE
jgi:phosphatidylserine/phosphatidylglycerophosphate/cardiolipin synthase-like enzyme